MKNYKIDFPFFRAHPELIYLDSAATTHKPLQVIERLCDFYKYEYASAHRSMHASAETATEYYEKARENIAHFIKAPDSSCIVFTKNATESIQIVAENWAKHTLKAGDEIVLSEFEHHSNIVPWQQFIKQGIIIRWIPITPEGFIEHKMLDKLITRKTKLVALSASSNVLGDVRGLLDNSLSEFDKAHFIRNSVLKAKNYGARVLIDASQLIPHERIDVAEWGCDFVVFSAHKMLGPQGIGVLYVDPALQQEFVASAGGGGAVFTVERETALWRPFPYNLEAGTQSVAQAVAFDAALTYFKENIDYNWLKVYENNLYKKLIDHIKHLKFIRVLGPQGTTFSNNKIDTTYAHHIVSFVVDSVHPHDCAAYLETRKILVRAGHHCASLLHRVLGAPEGSVRMSLYFYNTEEDIEKVAQALADMPSYFSI